MSAYTIDRNDGAVVHRCDCGRAVVDAPVCVECAARRLAELVDAAREVMPLSLGGSVPLYGTDAGSTPDGGSGDSAPARDAVHRRRVQAARPGPR